MKLIEMSYFAKKKKSCAGNLFSCIHFEQKGLFLQSVTWCNYFFESSNKR